MSMPGDSPRARPVVRVRLFAPPEQTARAAARLAEVFEILQDSGDRPARNAPTLRLRYLIVRLPTPADRAERRS